MRRILSLVRRDIQHVRGNIIALLVCVGLSVMPSLYAWFNIAGGWDPYANTGHIQVALANSDEGLQGSLLPTHINVGERVVNSLAGSSKIGYVVTSEDEAVDGVASGKYYAAVVIPRDFSSKLLSVLTKSPTHPQLDYYVNQKSNAIASIVTGKASDSVQGMVDEGFAAAASEVATELMGDLSSLLDDESVLSLASNLEGSLDRSLGSIRRSADNIAAYAGVVASIRSVCETSSGILGTNSLSLDAAKALDDAASSVGEFQGTVKSAEDAANSAVDAGVGSVSDVESAIDAAFQSANGGVDDLLAALDKAKEAASTTRDKLQTLYDALSTLNGEALTLKLDLDPTVASYSANIEAANTLSADISDLLSRLKVAISYLDDLVTTTDGAIADVQTTQGDAATNWDELKGLASQARQTIEEVRSDYGGTLSTSLGNMVDALRLASSDAASVSASVRGAVDKLEPTLGDASTGIQELEQSLNKASRQIAEVADKVETMRDGIRGAIKSDDVELVRTVFSADPEALVGFLSAPVELSRKACYPVENNGSAMTPYYTTMALWVGGTLLGILVYVAVSEEALRETGAKPRHAYFGRLAFFLIIGACQSTMLLLGDLYFLGVQCQNPVLFMLTGWLAGLVFINIVYSLATSFGDVGKAIGVLVMVVQVAGSGGTFPVQMLPPLFQTLYRFLPFVYSENAFRAAMFGTYGNDWLVAMGTLALYLVPSLLLGLLLRKPLVPLNEWIERKMEETKLM